MSQEPKNNPEISQKVKKLEVERAPGFMYFIDEEGDVSRVVMTDKIGGRDAMEKVVKLGLNREPGFLYFLDSEGDISRSKEAPPQETQ